LIVSTPADLVVLGLLVVTGNGIKYLVLE
jgi:hypothetical protein